MFLGEWTNGSNILGLVVFAIILGIALATLGEKGKPLLNFFTCMADAMMTITIGSSLWRKKKAVHGAGAG